MEKENFVILNTYDVVYKDKYFVKLALTTDPEVVFVKKVDEVGEVFVGDEVALKYDKKAQKDIYEVTKKGEGKEVSFEKSLARYFENKGINPVNLKELSKWVVICIYKHSVCIAKMFDLEEKRYIADTELVLNSQVGDLYYYLDDGKTQRYVYDAENNTSLCFDYARLFQDIELEEAKQGKKTYYQVAKEKLLPFEEEHTKLFNQKFKEKFIATFTIEERENKVGDQIIYRLIDDNDNSRAISSKELPKFAREGDVVGLTEDGRFEFDRIALLENLELLEEFGTNGG